MPIGVKISMKVLSGLIMYTKKYNEFLLYFQSWNRFYLCYFWFPFFPKTEFKCIYCWYKWWFSEILCVKKCLKRYRCCFYCFVCIFTHVNKGSLTHRCMDTENSLGLGVSDRPSDHTASCWLPCRDRDRAVTSQLIHLMPTLRSKWMVRSGRREQNRPEAVCVAYRRARRKSGRGSRATTFPGSQRGLR